MALSGEHQGLCPELWLQGVWCLHGRDRCGAVEGQHFGTLAELCLIWLLMGCGLASSKGCFCGSHCYTRYACFWILSLSVCLSVRPSVCLSVSLSLCLSLSLPLSLSMSSLSPQIGMHLVRDVNPPAWRTSRSSGSFWATRNVENISWNPTSFWRKSCAMEIDFCADFPEIFFLAFKRSINIGSFSFPYLS